MYSWHDQFIVILLRMESSFFLKLGKLFELVNQLCNSITVISTNTFYGFIFYNVLLFLSMLYKHALKKEFDAR